MNLSVLYSIPILDCGLLPGEYLNRKQHKLENSDIIGVYVMVYIYIYSTFD